MLLILLHPMKTAGTSIKYFLKRNIPNYSGKHQILGGTGHFTPDEILWRFDCDDDLFQTSFKISYVRNPYDRLVSFYHHMRTVGGHAEGLCKRWSFERFAMHQKLDQILLPCSVYHTYGVDGLIRFEYIDDDVHRLIETLYAGIAAPHFHEAWPRQEKMMFTKHKPYQEYYTQEMYDYVYAIYNDDFVKYGYEKH